MTTPETFLSYQRNGFTIGATATDPGRLRRTVNLGVRAATEPPAVAPAGSTVVDIGVELLGPGDVRGIAPTAFVRHFPESDAVDVDLDVMPYVELATADLPWRYSPDPPRARGDLVRPWLVLVVGTEQEVQVAEDGTTVTLNSRVVEAFPPSRFWRQAHVQQTAGGRRIARLLGAGSSGDESVDYQLVANSAHVVAVVPAFTVEEDGEEDGKCRPTWDEVRAEHKVQVEDEVQVERAVTVPCFHSWRFTTGNTPPFEEVAGRLRTPPLASGGGPGLGQTAVTWTDSEDQTLTWCLPAVGALRPAGTPDLPVVAGRDQHFVTEMLDRYRSSTTDALGLPIYHETVGDLPPSPSSPNPGWWATLDDHPIARVAAGLGAWCGIDWQDRLVDAVRDAAGDVDVLNQKVRYQATGERASADLFDRVTDDWRLLELAGPSLRRIWLTCDTFSGLAVAKLSAATDGALPVSLLSSAGRRALRRGTSRRRATGDHSSAALATKDITEATTRETVASSVTDDLRVDEGSERPDQLPGLYLAPNDEAATPDAAQAEPKVPGMDHSDLEAFVGGFASCVRQVISPLPDGDGVVGTARQRTWRAAKHTRPAPEGWGADRPIEVCAAIVAEPWQFLRDRAVEWILPGIGAMPEDSILGLQTNPAFIDAFLAGLNAQLLSELRWRNVPVAAGCTPVRSFWPARREEDGTLLDEVMPYRGSAGDLGQRTLGLSAAGAEANLWVVVARSWLFVRWPHTQVYLQRPVEPPQTPEEKPATWAPVVAGRIDGATVLFGFDHTPSDTDLLVLEEPPVGLGFQHSSNTLASANGGPIDGSRSAAAFAVCHLDQPARALVPVSELEAPG